MTESMVEKMRGAIFDVIWPAQEWNGEETTCRAVAEVAARAALQAMREPDDEMAKAGIAAWEKSPMAVVTQFTAMVDKAIQESGE